MQLLIIHLISLCITKLEEFVLGTYFCTRWSYFLTNAILTQCVYDPLSIDVSLLVAASIADFVILKNASQTVGNELSFCPKYSWSF